MHSIRKKHKKGPDFYPIHSSGRPTENHPHFRPAIPDTLDWQQLKKSTNNHKQQPSDQTDDERKQDGKCELKTQNSEYFHEHITFPTAWHHPAPPFVKTTIKIFRSITTNTLALLKQKKNGMISAKSQVRTVYRHHRTLSKTHHQSHPPKPKFIFRTFCVMHRNSLCCDDSRIWWVWI